MLWLLLLFFRLTEMKRHRAFKMFVSIRNRLALHVEFILGLLKRISIRDQSSKLLRVLLFSLKVLNSLAWWAVILCFLYWALRCLAVPVFKLILWQLWKMNIFLGAFNMFHYHELLFGCFRFFVSFRCWAWQRRVEVFLDFCNSAAHNWTRVSSWTVSAYISSLNIHVPSSHSILVG